MLQTDIGDSPDERVIEIGAGKPVEGLELQPRIIDQRPAGPGAAEDDGLR